LGGPGSDNRRRARILRCTTNSCSLNVPVWLRGLLAAGDPDGEVHEAWQAKEALRHLYTIWGDKPTARQWLNGLIADCRAAVGAEVRGLARTLVQWREPILAWHTTGHTNGPVEGLNGCASCSPAAAATGTYSEPHPAETRSATLAIHVSVASFWGTTGDRVRLGRRPSPRFNNATQETANELGWGKDNPCDRCRPKV
jgi:hypothetical protein